MVIASWKPSWQLLLAWLLGIIAVCNVVLINFFPLDIIRSSPWSFTFIVARLFEFTVLINTAVREKITRRKVAWLYIATSSLLGFFLFFVSYGGFNTDYVNIGIFTFMILGLATYFPKDVWSISNIWRVITNSLAITFSTASCLQSLIYYTFGINSISITASHYVIWASVEFSVLVGSLALYYRYKNRALTLVCIASLCLVLADLVGLFRKFIPGIYSISGLPEMSLYFLQAMSVMMFAYYSVSDLQDVSFNKSRIDRVEWIYWNGVPRFLFTLSVTFAIILHPPETWSILLSAATLFIREIFAMLEEHNLLVRLYDSNTALLTAQQQTERVNAELTQKNARLEQALGEVGVLEMEQEQERNRLAREIHDGIGQRLHASIMLAGGLLERESDPLRRRPLSLLLGALTGLEHEARRAVKALAATDEVGLEEGLARLLDYYRYGGPDSRLDVQGRPRLLSPLVRHTLYRIAQEALANAIKHARARQIVLALDYRDPQTVRLLVADDGVGLPAGDPQPEGEGGFGLRNMRERAALVGGHLSIDSSTQGVRIWVSIPHPSES